MSVHTDGRRGKTGTIGLTMVKLLLSNGKMIDAFELAKAQYPNRVSGNGQLYLKSEEDFFDVKLPQWSSALGIVGIYIKADSWIAPGTVADLQIWFDAVPGAPIQVPLNKP